MKWEGEPTIGFRFDQRNSDSAVRSERAWLMIVRIERLQINRPIGKNTHRTADVQCNSGHRGRQINVPRSWCPNQFLKNELFHDYEK